MLQKIRFGYGQQSHEEKMDILHNWYSDLNAYLPEFLEKTKLPAEKITAINVLLSDVAIRVTDIEALYNPAFEGIATCSPDEKRFRASVRSIKEVLDQITAISKVIDDQQTASEDGVIVG